METIFYYLDYREPPSFGWKIGTFYAMDHLSLPRLLVQYRAILGGPAVESAATGIYKGSALYFYLPPMTNNEIKLDMIRNLTRNRQLHGQWTFLQGVCYSLDIHRFYFTDHRPPGWYFDGKKFLEIK